MIDSLTFYGLGKLGLPLAASFAEAGVRVFGVDTNVAHVEALRSGRREFAEPGLTELVEAGRSNLSFHSDVHGLRSDASIILVPTPSDRFAPSFSSAGIEQAVASACRAAARSGSGAEPHLIVVSSTVMPGTLERSVKPLLAAAAEQSGRRFSLAYVPDLVALGDVVRGFKNPPCLVVGADDDEAGDNARSLYSRVVAPEVPRSSLTLAEAEMTKVAWNFYFCMKIEFANLLARLADGNAAVNVDKIAQTLAQDPRIGRGFLKPGMPFGGPCFPRDVAAMAVFAVDRGQDDVLMKAIDEGNSRHFEFICERAAAHGAETVGVLGLSFKAGTPVTIESPSFEVISRLRQKNIAVVAYDPAPEAIAALQREAWSREVRIAGTVDELCRIADTILVAVDDPLYSDIAERTPSASWIVDPWGRVAGAHPGLDQIGRNVITPGHFTG